MKNAYWMNVNTAWGTCTLTATDKGLLQSSLPSKTKTKPSYPRQWTKEFFFENKETPILKKAKKELLEYFKGNRKTFSVPFDFHGTDFQKKVWKRLSHISFGKTKNYAQIALEIKNPNAVRAVGGANNKNPLPIFIPCHRVIGKNGSMVGFAGGVNLKEKLLNHEQF